MTEGSYNHEQLIVAGVMLSAGTKEKKADTFFNHMDSECTKEITADQYTALLEVML